MSDIYMDVDVALAEVPVNILPLLDDTDFKTIETAVAYNAAGMDLRWNFVTSAGAFTTTAVTPTTGGDYDWAHQADGMYSIEMTATGGASINNDTEGYGWFTGVATGVLPWRGPIITFRAANTNDMLTDGTFSWDKIVLPVGAIPALGIIENGTAQSATASTLVLRAATSLADDLVNNAVLEATGGTGAGQVRLIVDWVSASDTATVNPNWTTTPDATTTYIVRAAPPAPTSTTYMPLVMLGADALTDAALAADAVTAVQSGLATAAELAKVPKSDGSTTWNATALASLQQEATDALNAYDPPTNTEMEARTIAAANYATAANLATVTTAVEDLPTNAELATALDPLPTAAENAAALLAAAVEGAVTVLQSLRLHNAVLTGKASGLGTATAIYRDIADSKDRITATVDSSGNRTAVTRDAS